MTKLILLFNLERQNFTLFSEPQIKLRQIVKLSPLPPSPTPKKKQTSLLQTQFIIGWCYGRTPPPGPIPFIFMQFSAKGLPNNRIHYCLFYCGEEMIYVLMQCFLYVLQVSIPDTDLHELQPCPKDMLVYIEARYKCVKGKYHRTQYRFYRKPQCNNLDE